jgi:hypothetical protein
MQPQLVAGKQSDEVEALLVSYSNGKVDRRHVMRRLDVSYGELLELLHLRGLDLPRVSDEDAERMVASLNAVLGTSTP